MLRILNILASYSSEKGFVVFTASTNIHSKCATVITKRNVENLQYTHI